MKTIREIATELGVSKQAVFQKIRKEPLATDLQGLISTIDHKVMVSDEGEKIIKQSFSQSILSGNSRTNSMATSQIDSTVYSLNDIEKLIKSAFSENIHPIDKKIVDIATSQTSGLIDSIINVLQTTIEVLQGQLEVKDKQLEIKDQQLEAKDNQLEMKDRQLKTKDEQLEQQAQTITKLSDVLITTQETAAAAQALHAGTMKQQLLSGETGTYQQDSEAETRHKQSWISRFFDN